MIPVEGRPGLYRDPGSNAIINTDTSQSKITREARQRAKQRDVEIEQLKSDVQEIKSMLSKLLER